MKKHVSHVLGKLSAANRTAAVARGRELGLIDYLRVTPRPGARFLACKALNAMEGRHTWLNSPSNARRPARAAAGRQRACGRERRGVAGDEIRVEGILDQQWTAWFEGLAIDSDHSQTVISGPVADQAALHGLLNRVCDLGLVIVSVRRFDPEQSGIWGLRRA